MPEYWFDHIHLRSPDPIKTAEFYEQMFGAKRISARNEGDGRASAKLDLKGVTILINQAREGDPTGLVHFGIRPPGNHLLSERQRLYPEQHSHTVYHQG